MNTIKNFRGKYDFLSNFYYSYISYEGITYSNAEAAFQSAKCADLKDRYKFEFLSPSEAKKTGRKINLRSDWENVKVDIMREIIKIKFSSNLELMIELKKTGTAELIEGNTWHDNFWGICECENCKSIPKKNMLGNLLMEYRTTIL